MISIIKISSIGINAQIFSLTGGKSECNASLAEGLATALVCFQDLEKLRDKETTTNKHCILISNSSPYMMPVNENECFEGKTVEQLAAIFVEKNINLSIISPRKIPVLYDIFEKSGGDVLSTAKNYSKDPRHLVLLKGFSLKERPVSPNINQNVQSAPVAPPAGQPNVPVPSPAMQTNEQMPMNPGNQVVRPMNPNIRQPMQVTGNQQPQQQGIPGQMGNAPLPQFQQQMGGQQMPNFPQRQPNPIQQQQQQQQQNPQQQQQRWMAPNQARQQIMTGQGNMPANTTMMSGNMPQQAPMMTQNQNQPQQQLQQQQQQNSALISQLTQPPNVGAMTPQQQAMARMAAIQNQQQNQQMMQQTQQQPNPNMNMIPNAMQNNPQMMAGNQQQNVQGVQSGGMVQQNQSVPQQQTQQMSKNEDISRLPAVTKLCFRSATAAAKQHHGRYKSKRAYLERNLGMERQAEPTEHNAPSSMWNFGETLKRN